MDWRSASYVAAGGALGSVARWLIQTWTAARFGSGFPWGTLGINILGSFLIGLVAAFALTGAFGISSDARIFLAVGFCGGFTTFSSFSLETLGLLQRGQPLAAGAYILSSVVIGLIAASAGYMLARALTPGLSS
jgi:CrcB protein